MDNNTKAIYNAKAEQIEANFRHGLITDEERTQALDELATEIILMYT